MRLGVGVNVDAGYQKMKDVHSQLKSQWMPFLSEQDKAGFRPHWTVMNKVDEEKEVEHALDEVRKELSRSTKEGQAIGLELWRYDQGNWIWANEYTFGDTKKMLLRTRTGESTAKNNTPGEQANEASRANKRPGMMKRGSSVADAWKSMSFRRKS